jgi:pyridoxal 5'-phosphate synthase pdxS subunit
MVDVMMEGYHHLEDHSAFDISPKDTPFGSMEELRREISSVLDDVVRLGRLPVVTFSAGGIATPADAALMMHHGMDGIFVGSGIFKSSDPANTADAIVLATHHFEDAKVVTEASAMIGDAMPGLEIESLSVRMEERGW